MTNKKKNIALLLGDPSGIGPELISKLLTQNELSNANITVIGEKNILNAGDKISGNNSDLEIVNDFDEINFDKKISIFWIYLRVKTKIIIYQSALRNLVKQF